MRIMASVCLATAGLLFALPACKTGPQTAAFKGYAATQVTAHEALVFWNSYLGNANPKPSQDVERQVLKVYNSYRASMLLVADAGAVWSAAVNNKEATQSAVDAAMAAFSQAVANSAAIESDYINLVSKLTGRPL